MEDMVSARPSVCFDVQKIIGISIGNGNMMNYQVQWAPTWVTGYHLLGCEHLIEAFLKQQSEKGQSVDDAITTTGVKDSDDLVTDTREDVSRDNNVSMFTSGWHSQEEDIPDQASMVVNSNTCLYSNTSNDNGILKVETNMETNVSNKGIYTSDMDASNETNTNFEWVKVEDDGPSLSFKYKNPHVVNDDTSGCVAAEGQHGKPNPIQEFQNDVLEVEKKEIMLEEGTETYQDSSNNDYGETSNSTENMLPPTGDMVNTCVECNASFTDKLHLKRHLLFHTGENPYQCNVCNKPFARKDSLEKHLKIHTAEKRYICVECNKSFKRKSSLINHFRLHTGEKPFKCTVCNKSFSHKPNLLRHFRLHTGEKPYKCSQCNKAFSDQSNFRAHLESCKHAKT